ncbi:MAG: substrate-binding domain-containing protein [Propionibacteriaceae bacterium]|nr:substrate-binding domain-containing protein [Propionibacteriaceae bacterium]MCL1841959.1 substrate-binding domain-containing protein [Propionibacteriaceae bacterium]
MKSSIKWAAAALAATSVLAFTAGCTNNTSTTPGATTNGSGTITLLLSTLDNPFFVSIQQGAQAEARAEGLTLTVQNANNDATTQANQIQTAVASKTKAIIINPVDSDAAQAAIQPALAAKIPVVAVDRNITGVTVNSFIASDNVTGGKQAADALARAINSTGNILVLEGTPGASSTRDRGQGFTDEIAKYPGIKIVASQTANFDETDGLNVTTNLMQAHPDVVAIYAQNDEMALGAVAALGSKAGTSVKVIGFDGSDQGLADVKAGTIAADVAQQPVLLGKQAVVTVGQILKGQTVQETQSMPVQTITKDNVDAFIASNSSAANPSAAASS